MTSIQGVSGAHPSIGDVMNDICDGDYYSTHPVFSQNDQALQILAYYDELTLTNPFMSRRNKYR